MDLKNFNLKSTFILVFIIIFIFLIILLIPINNDNKKNKITPTDSLFPTSVLINTPIAQKTILITPTLISIKDMTGVKEEILPPITQALIDQKQTLRQKMPLIEKNFSLDFNYSEDKFAVTLNNPKENSKKIFELWLSQNYPGISIDRFIIN